MSDGAVVRVGSVDLFVRRLGDPERPPLVVIHGGPTWDHSYLLPAIGELTDVAHVVLFDLRGCGRSARTPPVGGLPVEALHPALLADDVAALVRWLGVERADLLGFSYGGRVAMRVVDQHPDVLRGLVLASTSAYTGFEDELRARADYRERAPLSPPVDWGDPTLTGPDAPDGALSRAMAYASAPMDVWRPERRDGWRETLARVRFSSDWNAPFAAGTLPPGAPADPVGALRAWGGPVLILHGEHDLTFPVTVARRLHREVPASTLVELPEAAHMAHVDAPAEWVAAIRSFLRDR